MTLAAAAAVLYHRELPHAAIPGTVLVMAELPAWLNEPVAARAPPSEGTSADVR